MQALLLVFLAAPVAGFVVLVRAVLKGARSEGALSRRARWIWVAIGLASLAVTAYFVGWWSGGFFWPSGPEELCRLESDDGIPLTYSPHSGSLFPLSNPVCLEYDDTRVDLVPVWVNPTVIAALLGAVASTVAAFVPRRRSARAVSDPAS